MRRVVAAFCLIAWPWTAADVARGQSTNVPPIAYAAAAGDEPLVRAILDNAPQEARARGAFSATALSEAAKNGNARVVGLLLDYGAPLEAPPGSDSPLATAVEHRHIDVVRLLLDRGANLNASDGRRQETALMLAAANGDREMAALLLAKGAAVNVTDRLGSTALIKAAEGGHLPMVRLLLNAHAGADASSRHAGTALEAAIRRGHADISLLLLDRGAEPGDLLGEPALTDAELKDRKLLAQRVQQMIAATRNFIPACTAGQADKVAEYLKLCPRLATLPATDQSRPPLDYAIVAGQSEVVRLLIEHGADLTVPDSIEGSVLNKAIANHDLEMVKVLVSTGAAINCTEETAASDPPLYTAIGAGEQKIVEYLLDKHANVHAVSSSGDTPLNLAVEQDDLAIAKLLLDHGANPNTHGDRGTALRTAASRGNMEMVELLIDHGGDVRRRDGRGGTITQYAADARNYELTEFLIRRGAPVDAFVWLALGETQKLREILERRPQQVRDRYPSGVTLLHKAAQSNDRAAAELFLKYGADLNAQDDFGRTPLHAAVLDARLEMVQFLVDHKADVNATDRQNRTPLDRARGWRGLYSLLQANGAHPSSEIWPGETRREQIGRPPEFEGPSFQFGQATLFPGGQLRFESQQFKTLIRNVDGQRFVQSEFQDGKTQFRVVLDPANGRSVRLVETVDGKARETTFADEDEFGKTKSQPFQLYERLSGQFRRNELSGSRQIGGPALYGPSRPAGD